MSLLFCIDSSMARFSVSAGPVLAWGAGSCASAVKVIVPSKAMVQAVRPSLRISLLLLLWLPLFILFAGPAHALFIAQRFDWLESRRLVRRQITKKKSRRTGNQKGDDNAQARHRNAQ